MRIHPFKALLPRKESVKSPTVFFETMGKEFSKYFAQEVFLEHQNEGFYIYEVKNSSKSYKGIVTNTELKEMLDGKILFHENTIPEKVQDMVDTMKDRRAVIKPVLLFHKRNKRLSQIINSQSTDNESILSFSLQDGTTHTLWRIDDESVMEDVRNTFLFGIKKAYIADGHHRCKATEFLSAKKANPFAEPEYQHILTVYFPEDILEVYDHVKMVDISDIMTAEDFVTELAEYASVKPVENFAYPGRKREFLVIINGDMYKAKWKKQVLKSFEVMPDALDVYITNQVIFRLIFKIDDLRLDDQISSFSGNTDPKDILQKSKANPMSVLICQTPLSMSDIKKYSDKKKNLPPKSTWFEPRTKSGLIAQKF